jgi:hypothetical protein
MSGRVLNFTEFSDKYSNSSNEPVSIDDLTNASSNFEEGFDDETYDQPEIKPNRPVAGNYEITPSAPGETNAPAFSAENTEDMNAPQEESDESETELPNETEDTFTFNKSKESEEDESTEEESEEEEEEEDDEQEEGNPEAGANPKKKVEEGFSLVKGFAQFVNEQANVYLPKEVFTEKDYYANREEEEEDDTCPECGEAPIQNEYGTSCGCNM